jgi:hypothetical protein
MGSKSFASCDARPGEIFDRSCGTEASTHVRRTRCNSPFGPTSRSRLDNLSAAAWLSGFRRCVRREEQS